jgi:hypothetical protein
MYMSFSVYLNSFDGTKIVAGNTNQIEYNFAFDFTPPHDGGYKVYMTFASQIFEHRTAGYTFEDIYVNVQLGATNSYTPQGLYTGTKNNSVLGVVRVANTNRTLQTQINPGTTTATANIPASSETTAYTLTTTEVTPVTFEFRPTRLTLFAGHNENPPVYLPSKPRQNQFLVSLATINGTLQNEPEFQNTDYGLILTFEAV